MMARVWSGVLLAAVLAGCEFQWRPAFDEGIDAARLRDVAIADPAQALTFARVDADGAPRVLLVRRYAGGEVEGVDLALALGRAARDPIDLFREIGYEPLRALAAAPPAAAVVRVAVVRLVLPVDLGDRHVAAATNFPEHADDAGVENGPFLFAKLVAPSAPDAAVRAGAALLDYEVEVAWVTLEPLRQGDAPSHMGVLLCNDYTDRATLLRHIDVWNVESGVGFTTGKSAPGYLPVGDLFVIPRDFRAFVAALELRLYVNERLRQRAPARHMVWDFDAILAQTWARREWRWEHRGESVALPGESGTIAARTLFLAGTPHGTVFDGIRAAQMAAGAAAWVLGGWSQPPGAHVVERYIDDARRGGIYLQPGDRVVAHADRVGAIRNRIE